MEHDQSHGALADAGEFVELRGGRVWELRTASGERVVVDRGFRPNGGSTRSRWRQRDGSWRRLFGVHPVEAELRQEPSGRQRLCVAIGSRVEVWTGFRDIWRAEAPLVAVWELEDPEA